ncbi:sodium:dicarboxylate symporter-like protein [Dermatophagoides farinae]|nr:sodium:dicarboxylate symporter-like protein [Dermatophagoides farinae]
MDFGRRPAELEEKENAPNSGSRSLDKAAKRSRYGKVLYFVNKNLLAISTLMMIILSIFIAILLRNTLIPGKPWTQRRLLRLSFVGEIFIRVLLSLIVPLIGTSIAYACTGFDPESSGRIMSEVIVYYLTTTGFAAIEGLIMVTALKPGYHTSKKVIKTDNKDLQQQQQQQDNSTKTLLTVTIEDTILDICRNIFTDSLFGSWIDTYHTKLIPPDDSPNDPNIENWRIESTQERGANVMSVVVVGLLIGLSVNMIRTRGGRLIAEIIETTNTIMMMITLAVVQTAPVCTVFLIIPQILIVDDIGEMFRLVGWFTLTVLLSLAVHCLVILSLIYLLLVRHNPYKFLTNMFPAISTAFATSSSSATMSVTMQCLEQNAGIEPSIVRFVIPFGSTVNMDGAALYESVAAIFVAQYRRKSLNFGQLVTIAMTSILVSIGAAGIPQAGMITTVVVLNSIGLSLEDAALVMVVDFMLDRFRTVVNVLGDAFGAAVVGNRLKHMFKNTTNTNINKNAGRSPAITSPSQTTTTTTTDDKDFNQIKLRQIESIKDDDLTSLSSSSSMTTMATLSTPKTMSFDTKSSTSSSMEKQNKYQLNKTAV